MPNDSKHIQAGLSLIPTDWSHLRVAQVPRCRDLAIFVVTTDGDTADYLPLRMRAGVIIRDDVRHHWGEPVLFLVHIHH